MTQEKPLDFLLLGPAFPYRGGIASTQHALAKSLIAQGYRVKLWTFTQLYPNILFPGKTQYSTENSPEKILIERRIHAFNPLGWRRLAKTINQLQPKAVVFRYWSPFLSPCWTSIAKGLNTNITKVGWVDNWYAHEPKPIDQFLTKRFEKAMDRFATLSPAIANQINQKSTKKVWGKMHPIDARLPKKNTKKEASKKLNLTSSKTTLLFFGLIRAYKGLRLLLEAIKNHPEKHLFIVGECYENWREYQSLIDNYQIEHQITVIDRFVSEEEASVYFSAADAVVLPYITATQSGVLTLAYHFETPLVVTNHPGLSEPVLNDQTGIVCPPQVGSLSNAITEVTEEMANQRFRKNLAQTKHLYSWSNYAKEWANFCLQ